jgi:AraC-like DNA-binding protein
MGVTLVVALLCLINIQDVNKSGNKWLGVFILCICFRYVDDNLRIAGANTENVTLLIILNLSVYVLAPVFYYTISYFVIPDRRWKIKDYLHLFWLAMLYLALASRLLFEKTSIDKQKIQFLIELESSYLSILHNIQIFYYSILSLIKLKEHQKNIRSFTSTVENVDLKWLKYMIICVFIMGVFVILSNLFPFSNYDYLVLDSLYLVGFFIIAYFSLKQKEIYPFTADQKNEILHTIIEKDSKKLEPKKLLEDDKLRELKSTLTHIMEEKKPFLDCELNLVKLSATMDISLHQLSYLINTGFNENFYQFINRYRIEEAKKMILDEKMNHLSLQGIALDVGFKSKSVFNTTFKTCVGKTPSEYKAQKRQEVSPETSSDLSIRT